MNAAVQKSAICLFPLLTAVDACRFAAAFACPRAEPATAFAPLSHMLINGFFFVHGFFMTVLAGWQRL
ncbi:hypothetical protein [Caballeronia telluris]|uniref:hypothetical protein n=1 Tax=Caballeronia telluris TaxID=326475 RepID=UPI00135827DC|nr:hypothetical protein [Caballeronia telluris]